MKGSFRLYYRDGNVDLPGVGVTYEVTNSAGASVASGITDAKGETKTFEGASDKDCCSLVVRLNGRQWTAPDTATPDADTTIELSGPQVQGHKIQRVRLVPYYQVCFVSHADHRPIPGAKFSAYALDANGKEAAARDSDANRVITGTTDADGKTPIIHCSQRLVFKFQIPKTTVSVASGRLTPLLQGQPDGNYVVPLKTVAATTQPKAEHEVHLAGKASLPFLISPQDDELIMIGQADFDEFEEVSGRLDKIMAAKHVAKLDLSRALESGDKAQIEAAEKALNNADEKIKSELNKNFSKSADLKEVITFETYSKGPNSSTGSAQMGLRRRYLRTDKYMQLRNKRLNKTEYKLNVKFAGPAGNKGSAEVKPKTLDAAALKESFAKIKTSLKYEKKWEADPKIFNLLDVAGNQYADTIMQSETYQVDAQAQWLRLVGGAGASAEVDWKSKKAKIQGNLQGKIVLCEGKITGQYAVPSLKGWMMQAAGEDLGAIRFVVEVAAYGFAGAKVVATGAVGISLQGGKQVAHAVPVDVKDSYAKDLHSANHLPKFDPMGPYEKAPDNLNGLDVGIDAFAGAEAGVTPAGKIQWLPPQEKDFVSFAEVSGTLAGNAGAGLSASLAVYYDTGKFRVRASARLCWGLGGKGALEFTVDGAKVAEFVKWLHYQLLYAGFKQMVNISHQAFMAYSQVLILLMKEGCSPKDVKRVEAIVAIAEDTFGRFEQQMEIAEQRNALVNNINRAPHWLVHAPPETRGMLLYQITRHGMPSHLKDTPEVGGTPWDPQVHYLPQHKKAICTIMKLVQTAAEWDNVMQHMTARGAKSATPAGKNEGDVLRFLNNGLSLAELPPVFEVLNGPVMTPVSDKSGSGNDYLDQYLGYRGKLMGKFPKGYKVAALDSPAFEMLASMDGEEHPQFGEIQTACLGEAYAGDPGSSLA